MKKNNKLEEVKEARSMEASTSSNCYDEQHQMVLFKGHYEKARAYMQGKSYVERRLTWYEFSWWFRSIYHFVSVILALMTTGLIAVGHLDMTSLTWLGGLFAGLSFFLLLTLFVILEWGKKQKMKDVFYQWVSTPASKNKTKVPTLQWIYLGLLVGVSLVMSAIGGALLGDLQANKKKVFEGDKNKRIQQIEKGYKPRLSQLSSIIAGLEALATNTQVRRWGLTQSEQRNLMMSKAERDSLMVKKEQLILKLEMKYHTEMEANQVSRWWGMGLGFGIILCLELLTVYAYYFHNVFMQRVELEGVQYEVLSDPKESTREDINSNEILGDSFQTMILQVLQAFKETLKITDGTLPRNEISLRPSRSNTQTDEKGEVDLPSKPGKGQGDMAIVPDKSVTSPKSKQGGTSSNKVQDEGDMAAVSDKADTPPKSKKGGMPSNKVKDDGDMAIETGQTIHRKRGYYIPPECFERYFAGRGREDQPYRKLRWYEAVIPDLQQGLKYREILAKEYNVYDFQQDRYVKKRISETTLKATIVRGLKTLANPS